MIKASADDVREFLVAVRREMDRVGLEQVVARGRKSGETGGGVAQNSRLAPGRLASQLDVLLVERNDVGKSAYVAAQEIFGFMPGDVIRRRREEDRSDPGLARFIDQVARRVEGRVVVPDLDGLGAAVVGDYLRSRRRR